MKRESEQCKKESTWLKIQGVTADGTESPASPGDDLQTD